jgi:thiosulfate/3-mercaptopyruvate sulfurtransferase
MFLMLEHLGLKGNVYWLNGGLEAWKKASYEVTNKPTVVARKGSFKASINPVVVDKDYVLSHLDSPSTQLVDARPTRYYDGDPVGYPRDGHIKGAKNIVYQEMVDESNEFKAKEQLEAYFNPIVSKDKEVVTYCFIGQTASVVYLAGRILGYNMKLYDGSMQEWSRIPELPMEKTEK